MAKSDMTGSKNIEACPLTPPSPPMWAREKRRPSLPYWFVTHGKSIFSTEHMRPSMS